MAETGSWSDPKQLYMNNIFMNYYVEVDKV